MTRKVILCLSTALLSLSLTLTSAATPDSTAQLTPTQSTIQQPLLMPAPPEINAKAYVLMDAASGKILAQKNMEKELPPASLTKMMTLYLTSRALQSGSVQLDDTVTITQKAWKMGGSKMFVKVGSQVAVRDLLQGVIVDSGNDACVSLAQYIGGGEKNFVRMMNDEAKSLGMTNTHYSNSMGLPAADHYSTAQDLAILARALIRDFPEYYPWYKQKWFKYSGIRQPNRNRLLWRYADADGIKTGHTDQAGFCLVASAKRNDMRLISVVLGTPSDSARANTSIRLLEYGFRFFSSNLIHAANTPIETARVWGGENKTIPVGMLNDLAIVTPRNQFHDAIVKIDVPDNIYAPIKKGQVIGHVTVVINQTPVDVEPLVALADNNVGGIWRRSTDHLYRWTRKLFRMTNAMTFAVNTKTLQQPQTVAEKQPENLVASN